MFDRISQGVETALRDSVRSIEEIDEVILVGGSSKMPVISLYLQTQLKRKPSMVASPDEVVAMGVGIYQGEAFYCNDNLRLGAIEMDIQPLKKGQNHLKVCFTYDINGILEVEVTDCTNPGVERTKRKVLASENLRLSEEEIERRLEELRTYKLMPCGGIRTKMVMARGERLFSQTLGARRQQVVAMMQKIQQAVASRNDQMIARCLKEAEEVFDCLEE